MTENTQAQIESLESTQHPAPTADILEVATSEVEKKASPDVDLEAAYESSEMAPELEQAAAVTSNIEGLEKAEIASNAPQEISQASPQVAPSAPTEVKNEKTGDVAQQKHLLSQEMLSPSGNHPAAIQAAMIDVRKAHIEKNM